MCAFLCYGFKKRIMILAQIRNSHAIYLSYMRSAHEIVEHARGTWDCWGVSYTFSRNPCPSCPTCSPYAISRVSNARISIEFFRTLSSYSYRYNFFRHPSLALFFHPSISRITLSKYTLSLFLLLHSSFLI